MAKKLTEPQRLFLADIGYRPHRVVRTYKPAHALIELGLATGELCEGAYALNVSITDAGRQALAAAKKD